MRKTILEWLNSIEDKTIKANAITELLDHQASKVVCSLSNALIMAFFWDETDDGYKYWKNVHKQFELKE